MQHQPGVVGAEVVLHIVLQLEAGHDALPLPPDRRLETAGRSPGVEPGVVYMSQVLHHQQQASYMPDKV